MLRNYFFCTQCCLHAKHFIVFILQASDNLCLDFLYVLFIAFAAPLL